MGRKFTFWGCFALGPLVYKSMLLRSDREVINSGSGPERPKDSVIIWKASSWVGVVVFLFILAGKKVHFIPHMGLIAVFKIFQLLCHVRLC